MSVYETVAELAKAQGFSSEAELHRLVCSVPLGTPEQVAAFRQWQLNDGSKAGILRLIPTEETP